MLFLSVSAVRGNTRTAPYAAPACFLTLARISLSGMQGLQYISQVRCKHVYEYLSPGRTATIEHKDGLEPA